METLHAEPETEPRPARFLTQRQEDALIYKMMAFIIFAIVGLPIGYVLTRGSSVPADVRLLSGIFAFDAGWDLALLVSRRADMLVEVSPRLIVGKALERTVPVGFMLLFFSLEGDARVLAIVVFVAWSVAPLLMAPRPAALARERIGARSS